MGLSAKRAELETKLASIQAQLDIVKAMQDRGEDAVAQGTISDHIMRYLRGRPEGAGAHEIITFVTAVTGANDTSVRTRISKLVSQGKVLTDGKDPFIYRVP